MGPEREGSPERGQEDRESDPSSSGQQDDPGDYASIAQGMLGLADDSDSDSDNE
jgi:hypothetical protein